MVYLAAIVGLAVILMLVAGRRARSEEAMAAVALIDDHGLTVQVQSEDRMVDHLLGWPSVFEVSIVARRRLGGSVVGFEARTEAGGVVGAAGAEAVEALLAQSHRLPGFDHQLTQEVLSAGRGRQVVYRG